MEGIARWPVGVIFIVASSTTKWRPDIHTIPLHLHQSYTQMPQSAADSDQTRQTDSNLPPSDKTTSQCCHLPANANMRGSCQMQSSDWLLGQQDGCEREAQSPSPACPAPIYGHLQALHTCG
jgi:hypothetical protein